MDKVTQSNAASAEETAAAAEQLNAQAEELRNSSTQLAALVGVKVDTITAHPIHAKAAQQIKTLSRPAHGTTQSDQHRITTTTYSAVEDKHPPDSEN
jgi:methyl-accepting chemotaxis protein